MISWCAYCTSFIGELKPYEKLQISHGMCDQCFKSDALMSADYDAINQLNALLKKSIQLLQYDIDNLDLVLLYEEASALGMRKDDLLLGLLQPLLEEVGRLFSTNQVSAAVEHIFTEKIDWVLEMLKQPKNSKAVSILMYLPGDNCHTLGPRFFEYALQTRGFDVLNLPVATDDIEFIELVKKHQPRLVGFSTALPQHIHVASTLIPQIKKWSPESKLAIGGYAIKNDTKNEKLRQFDFIAKPETITQTIAGIGEFLLTEVL